ncbi:hypothetical protein [Bradyrhizobium sp. CB2312]|uniref:hypothetical protein n=1 Tax=Bradyrhizobium sp. CB2312 TaxID=3039155 RepID=UPI0024B0CC60|nr:hypothetical protein [Bradyrhizobium sp. CB2312]WFU69255.1 hypothetical protein QA642_28685 [Bradyrhizobium sp. CB2312]
MAFIAFAKLIKSAALTPEQRKELKSILLNREKQLKKAIKDVESALAKLERTGRKAREGSKGRR